MRLAVNILAQMDAVFFFFFSSTITNSYQTDKMAFTILYTVTITNGRTKKKQINNYSVNDKV